MKRVSTGIAGLDELVVGGFISGRAYVVRGKPGSGKTICGMHFLNAALARRERALFISFDQSETQVLEDAAAIGLKLDHQSFLDLSSPPDAFTEMHTYDIFSPPEVERDPLTKIISERILEVKAQRVFIDGFIQFGRLTGDEFHFRRLVQAFFRFATQAGATLLVSLNDSNRQRDAEVQSIADGVVDLGWAQELRTVQIKKFRGSAFRAGVHPIQITEAGILVSPEAA